MSSCPDEYRDCFRNYPATMSIHETKYCPRCNAAFKCKAGNILLCQCYTVKLNDKEKEYLNHNYTDCLCAACLKEIKIILNNTSIQKDV